MSALILPGGGLIGCAVYFVGWAVWGQWFPTGSEPAPESEGDDA